MYTAKVVLQLTILDYDTNASLNNYAYRLKIKYF